MIHLGLTAYHSKYFAAELLKRISSDSIEKLGTSVFNATVDLNPHQLDAALFAFRSPLSSGAILADEVGLGKTIEAGLVVSQLWAERKRRILVIAPTILRKQWAQELSDKFFISSIVLDTREYNARAKVGLPLEPEAQVVICSYQFARRYEAEIRGVPWNLVVIDEAHRLRNVYKSSNKIANAIKQAVKGRSLLLLTATPLQNTLLELFGLVSFLDEHVFGDIEAFRARYMRGALEDRDLLDLRRRLKPLCQRTLRRQVQEYVRFTQRISITEDFTPSEAEQRLYDQVSEYLARPDLFALPASQRQLTTMVLRKLLASSTFAIAGTLNTLAQRLTSENPNVAEFLGRDYEGMGDLAEEWSGDETLPETQTETKQIEAQILREIRELNIYSTLATSITENAKGAALLTALKTGFRKLEELRAERKAVIFTESRRTQSYLLDLLHRSGYSGRVLTINGTNTDDRSGEIYKSWIARHRGEDTVTGNKAVDLRAALVEQFRDYADILVATEAAAEGVNLQFCSLVVNYDLPWNPQRIEQRIGRCHRYGQKHDVVVINFLNRSNEADRRVFQLLDEKFQLFQGVFGSSDEVLGVLVESGVDFERRIAEIYQTCRTTTQIDSAFAQLQLDLDEQINVRMKDTRTKLLENFDEEVASKLRIEHNKMRDSLHHLERCLWGLTQFELAGNAKIEDDDCRFELTHPLKDCPSAPPGSYQLATRDTKHIAAHAYRPNHPLAQSLISKANRRLLEPARITFDYTQFTGRIGLIEPLVGSEGFLLASHLTISALEDEDRLLFAILDLDCQLLDPEIGEKLFRLQATSIAPTDAINEPLQERLRQQTQRLQRQEIFQIEQRNSKFFDAELEKLERWADDLKHGLEIDIKDIDVEIKQARREAPYARDLAAKLEVQRRIKDLESERMKKRRSLFDAQDDIDTQKETLIAGVEARLRQSIKLSELFMLQWKIV